MNLSDYLANDQRADAFSWFLKNKFGYGSWNAPYWFIGMEEAGGCSCGDVINRISSWRQAEHGLEDLREYCASIGEDKWFMGNNEQQTWQGLIRLLMAAAPEVRGENTELAFQHHRWGRRDGLSCVVEFSPLPSPTTRTWRYSEWCQHGAFANRLTSRADLWGFQELGISRVTFLKERIAAGARNNTLKWVVFYGRGDEFQPYFDLIAGRIAGQTNQPINNRMTCGVIQVEGHQIPCLFTGHPVPRYGKRWTNDEVVAAGGWLRAQNA